MMRCVLFECRGKEDSAVLRPVFFRRLLEQYGLEPLESIMIGNDEAADIAGAQSVGMDTLYIHTEISPEEYGKVQATYRVMDGDFRKIAGLILKD